MFADTSVGTRAELLGTRMKVGEGRVGTPRAELLGTGRGGMGEQGASLGARPPTLEQRRPEHWGQYWCTGRAAGGHATTQCQETMMPGKTAAQRFGLSTDVYAVINQTWGF